jgi:hypothetical protein
MPNRSISAGRNQRKYEPLIYPDPFFSLLIILTKLFFFLVHGSSNGRGIVGRQWHPMARSHLPPGPHGSQGALPNGKVY